MSASTEAPSEVSELRWWGVTIGSQAYLVCAKDRDEALKFAFLAISDKAEEDRRVTTFAHLHEEAFQRLIGSKYGPRRQSFRVRPFSWDMYPGAVRVFFNDKGERVEPPNNLAS